MVVGGGNSAGQAAVFLSQTAASRVHMLVRGDGLADSMSRYLDPAHRREPGDRAARRTPRSPRLDGDEHLERVTLADDRRPAGTETQPIRHVFMMTGAVPATGWLNGCVATRRERLHQDRPGPAAGRARARRAGRSGRAPFLLETQLPGVFAVGDVRGGNVKRVASAVGEGSIAVAFVHQVLHE